MPYLSSQNIVLYACNTGSLYQEHLRLARSTNTDGDWIRHIQRRVLPAYRRELKEPDAQMLEGNLRVAAAELRAYYTRHVSEF